MFFSASSRLLRSVEEREEGNETRFLLEDLSEGLSGNESAILPFFSRER